MATDVSKLQEKFANLPAEDLDTTGPDVFETADVPGALNTEAADDDDDDFGLHGAVSYQPPNREDLLTESLDPSHARERFKGHYLQSGDFSGKMTRRYPPRLPESRVYEMLPRGYGSSNIRDGTTEEDSETPLARLRRLKYEMDELEEQLEKEPLDTEASENQKVSPAVLLNQLKMLKGDWSRLSQPPQPAADRAPPAPSTSAQSQNASAELSFTRLAEQVNALETLVGSPASTELPPPVLPVLDKLSHQLNLLSQPRHLDTLNRRIKTLVSDLDRIHETRRKLGDTTPLHLALNSGLTVSTTGSGEEEPDKATEGDLPPDILPRLQALFNLLPRLQALSPVVPGLLLRLRSLADLHASAASFDTSLTEAQASVTNMQETQKSLETVLANVQSSLQENQAAMEANVASIHERVIELAKRVQNLQS